MLLGQRGHPAALVFGTFATSDAVDHQAPTMGRLRGAAFHDETVMAGTSCQSQERWIDIEPGPAADPGGLQPLMYAVWFGDARGKLDLKAAPDQVVAPRQGSPTRLIVGGTGMCAPFRPKLPDRPGPLVLGVAALDSAGQRSKVQRTQVVVPRRTP